MTIVNQLLSYLTPHLIESGQYALEVRKRIKLQDNKEKYSGNIFSEVLTDADLSIQNKIEVALLAKFPEISFFGEEEDKSLNAKYFPEGAELTVLLDPIDGTRYFVDNVPGFNVLLSIVSKNQYEAVLMHLPEQETTYVAERGKGAWKFKNDTPEKREAVTFTADSPYLIYSPGVAFKESLPDKYTPYHFIDDYGSITPPPSTNSLLWNGAVGAALTNPQAIDALAIGFLVQEAGGVCLTPDGEPLVLEDLDTTRVYPCCIIAQNQSVAEDILNNASF